MKWSPAAGITAHSQLKTACGGFKSPQKTAPSLLLAQAFKPAAHPPSEPSKTLTPLKITADHFLDRLKSQILPPGCVGVGWTGGPELGAAWAPAWAWGLGHPLLAGTVGSLRRSPGQVGARHGHSTGDSRPSAGQLSAQRAAPIIMLCL